MLIEPNTLNVTLGQVNGNGWTNVYSAEDVVERFFGDDFGAPASSIVISGLDADGNEVKIRLSVPRKR